MQNCEGITEQKQRIARWWRIGLPTGILAGTLFLSRTYRDGPGCVFRLLFHVPCPGCGLTRSLEDIWRADVVLSFRHHPLGLPLFLLCWMVLCSELFRLRALTAGILRLLGQRVLLRGLTALLLTLWGVRLWLSVHHVSFFLW